MFLKFERVEKMKKQIVIVDTGSGSGSGGGGCCCCRCMDVCYDNVLVRYCTIKQDYLYLEQA